MYWNNFILLCHFSKKFPCIGTISSSCITFQRNSCILEQFHLPASLFKEIPVDIWMWNTLSTPVARFLPSQKTSNSVLCRSFYLCDSSLLSFFPFWYMNVECEVPLLHNPSLCSEPLLPVLLPVLFRSWQGFSPVLFKLCQENLLVDLQLWTISNDNR
jgi:hypothetical protein